MTMGLPLIAALRRLRLACNVVHQLPTQQQSHQMHQPAIAPSKILFPMKSTILVPYPGIPMRLSICHQLWTNGWVLSSSLIVVRLHCRVIIPRHPAHPASLHWWKASLVSSRGRPSTPLRSGGLVCWPMMRPRRARNCQQHSLGMGMTVSRSNTPWVGT